VNLKVKKNLNLPFFSKADHRSAAQRAIIRCFFPPESYFLKKTKVENKIHTRKQEIKDKIINFKKITPPVNPAAQ